jgi:glycosyltransferase involved in cell wall biosynthesis
MRVRRSTILQSVTTPKSAPLGACARSDLEPPAVGRPVRVLWLIKGLGPGGAERLLTLCARYRDRSRFRVRTAYLLPHKDALVAELEAEGVPVACLGRPPLRNPRWLWSLRRSLLAEPVDVVHAHSPLVAVGARLVLRSLPRSARPKMVTTDHNVWASHRRTMRWADAATCPLDDAHLTVSEAVRASMPGALRSRAEVVTYGVDVERVRSEGTARDAVRAELGIDQHALIVATVANLRPAKAYPDLLAAATIVLAALPDVRFVAVGQGPQEAEIRALHARLGLGDGFQLLGHRPDAIRIMGACDVFCLASLYEGLPVALMEALVLGLPAVATDVGGIREVVEPGREAVLVPPGRPDALAGALVSVLSDPEKRIVMAAAAEARGASLSIDVAARRMEAIYGRLVRSRSPGMR